MNLVETWKILIYGRPGCGKTRLMGTALECPELCPVLYIATPEAGLRTVASKIHMLTLNDLDKPVADKLNCIKVSTWKDFCDVYAKLAPMITKFPYKAVICDSITGMADFISASSVNNSLGDLVKVRGAFQNEYKDASARIIYLLKALESLKCHVILTGWPREIELPGQKHIKEEDREREITLMATGRNVSDITGWVQFVGILKKTSSSDWSLSFNGNNREYAKFQAEDSTRFVNVRFDKPEQLNLRYLFEYTNN